MKKQDWSKLFMACACVGAGYLLGHLCNAPKNETEPQPEKQKTEETRTAYQHKYDSLKCHYDGEKIGLYNDFRAAVEDINESRATKASKNAIIAKEANKYIADHDSIHMVLITKIDEAWQQNR